MDIRPKPPQRVPHPIFGLLHQLEDALLCALLTLLVLLAASQILMRNLGGGFVWGEELLRILVLWLCFLGAIVASRKQMHITMDIFTRFMPPRIAHLMHTITASFTATVCGILAYHSWAFVEIEREFGSMLLGGRVPAWVLQSILPAGFALIGLRYAVYFFIEFYRILVLKPEERGHT